MVKMETIHENYTIPRTPNLDAVAATSGETRMWRHHDNVTAAIVGCLFCPFISDATTTWAAFWCAKEGTKP